MNPGQAVSVTVTSPAGFSFNMVYVIGQSPFPSGNSIATSVPANFSLTIPTDISCRKYMLTATGVTSSGQGADSATILVQVERPDLPTALSEMNPGPEIFDALGALSRISLLGTFSDGSILDVTNSSYMTYSSSNTSVAAVDSTGTVTAGVAGSATITATYTLAGQSVQLAIPVTVNPPWMLVTPPSLTFGSQNIGTSSAPQQITITNQLHGPMTLLSLSATGDFSESDNCNVRNTVLEPGGSCTANVTFTPTAAGPRAGALQIDNNSNGMLTAALAGTGLALATTTAVTSSANPSVFGHNVTFTATVTPDPGGNNTTGSVRFADGPTLLGTVSLNNGVAAYSTSSLAVGSHSITATYSGDSTYQGSAGSLTQVVNSGP